MHTLRPYQERAVQKIIGRYNGRSLLAADPGLGKTLMSLECVKRMPRAWPVVVVCPAAVKWGWQKQALAHLNIHTSVLDGEKPTKLNNSLRHQILVINYDILQYWRKELIAFKPKTLILDECQNIANRRINRTKACQAIARRVPFVFGLSGTPLMNRPVELFPMINLLWPQEFDSFWAFGHQYCDPKLGPWGWEFKGATNLEELNAKLTRCGMIRIVKSEVENLPKKTRRIELMPLSDPAEYQAAVSDFLGWLSKQSVVKSSRAKRAAKLVQITHLKQLVAKLKARSVVNWINQWMADHPRSEKLVVAAWHKGMIKLLHKRCEVKSITIDGSTSNKHRRQFVDSFCLDKSIRLLIGNIRTIGTGVDGIQRASRSVAFAELPWRPTDILQMEDRCFRIGQDRETKIYFLVAQGTVEEKLCRMLQAKQNVVSDVLDGGRRVEDLAIHDQLVQILLRESKVNLA